MKHMNKWRFAAQLGLLRLTDPGDDGGSGSEDDDSQGEPSDDDEDEDDTPSGSAKGRKAPWNKENFDAERASRLFERITAEKARAQAQLDKLQKQIDDAENAKLTDQQRLEKELEKERKDGSDSRIEAARLRALIKYGLEEDDLELLGGSTPEEIESRAAKLAERLRGPEDRLSGKPRPKLRAGTDPTRPDPEETDPTKLAEMIPR